MKSNILKLSLFATGLSGIVAEYILATLATYFLGDSIFQWTMILSIMLFSMGLGSRISKFIDKNLLERFILIEFTLSVLVSFCALTTYFLAGATVYHYLIIYGFSIIIGLLIGLEIPIVIRLNDQFEELKVNVSAVMEKDYYGSLLGGIFFVFVGLPQLGLTYTPFVLGGVNLIVAFLLLIFLGKLIDKRLLRFIQLTGLLVTTLITLGVIFAQPIVQYGEQKQYKDKVVYTGQSKYQRLVITQYKDNYWFYINTNQQLSTADEHMYHEPMTHPVMKLSEYPRNVLILGGGDGCVAREVLKYPEVEQVKLVDLDPMVTDLAKNNAIFTEMNDSALWNPKVEVLNTDAYTYMQQTKEYYDVIIVDFPDPKSVELARLYSYEFYKLCYQQLRPNGLIIIQSGSPYFATKAFLCIGKTLKAAGFNMTQIHNQVITLGQWGWTIGAKNIPEDQLVPRLRSLHFDDIPTDWLNHDAMYHITAFGKPLLEVDSSTISINKVHEPVLDGYYRQGNWEWY
ncbi:MAG: polyamine aminopropyltransferase [Saprospiraceae bacterium]|nr:polyamine aminopropyltransferase [Saprospiraceae bacterium]